MKRLLLLLSLLSVMAIPAFARGSMTGFCQQGNVTVLVSGQRSSNKAQGSFPGCTVTVYLPGTLTPATIYSDNNGTPLANPFTVSVGSSSWQFYADNLTYDIGLSGAGLTPFTQGNIPLLDMNNVTRELSDNVLFTLGFTFAQACTQAAAINATLVVSNHWNNIPNQSCSAINIRFIGGGLLTPGSGQTVTLGPKSLCGITQFCYDISSGGTIAFTIPPVTSPVQWGADTTGAADSSAAFGAAWNAARSGISNGGTVNLPCANFKLTLAVTYSTAFQQVMLGSGNCTNIIWSGAASGASVFLFPNCFACEIGKFQMNFTTAANAAIQTANNGSGFTATQDIFRSIVIQANAFVNVGFLLDGPVDGNNDQQRFIDDHTYGTLIAGWQLGSASAGFNVLDIEMDHCTFVNSGYSQYGVWFRHGSFHWHDGDGGGNYLADFELDTGGNDGIKIDNGEFENSKQLIHTLISAGVSLAVTVHDVTWDGSCSQQTQAQIKINCPGGPQPGPMMELGLAGPWVFFGNRIGVNNHDVLSTIALDLDPSVFPASYTFIGNAFGTSATTNAQIFNSQLPTMLIGNSVVGVASALNRLDDLQNYPTTINRLQTFNVFPAFGTLATTSWTPTLRFGGASVGVTYASQIGSYFKIGDLTYFTFVVTLTSKGSSTGVATIGGLPTTATFGGAVEIQLASNFSGLTSPSAPIVLNGANFISLNNQGTTTAGAWSDTNFTNTSNMFGYGWYK